jgi:transcriptional regulator with XRE-family HTH domain
MDKNRIGLQIKAYRKRLGLTQEQLGEKLGMSKQQIGYYENGHRTPTLDKTLPKICEALGVDFDVILKKL